MTLRLPMPGKIYQPSAPTRWLTTFLHVTEQDVMGCSAAEIAEVEAAAGRPLPLAYRQWLREAGRGIRSGVAADHFQRSHMAYPRLLELRAVALEALQGWGNASLLQTAFPFYNWEFWCTYLLDLSQPWDDPPVLMLDADGRRIDRRFGSFSEFMMIEIFQLADALEMRRRLG